MPIIYSFSTESSQNIPVSDEFSCSDFSQGMMPSFLLYSGMSSSRGYPWLSVDGNDLVLISNDGVETSISASLPIGRKFTAEFQIQPSSIPRDLSALNQNRFFIAVFDTQDNAGGVLISKTGLAIVSSFGNTVMPIFGSNGIIEEGNDYYTLRIVVDGTSNIMDLYVTKTSELADTGHQLRYTTAAPITPSGTPDHVKIEVLGHQTNVVKVGVTTFRVNCSELVIPNKRPVADVGRDQTSSIGSIVGLDGTRSYDPEGEDLTYKWFVFASPEGSSYRADGTAGFTVDDGDADNYTMFFEQAGNPWSLANSPSLQPGDILIVGGNQYILDNIDWVYNSLTNRYDRNPGFDGSRIRISKDILPDNLIDVPWTLYHQSTFFDDRTSPTPNFVPDINGMYGVQLVVNDGELDSLPSQGLVNVAETNVILGHIPDVNFIWDYLSDAWGLFDDRGPITTIWSSVAQIASNILLTAWQLDYSKSLVDIQRKFQRRWLPYRTCVEEPEPYRDRINIKIIRGEIRSADIGLSLIDFSTGKSLIIQKDGQTYTIVLSGILTAWDIVNVINEGLGENNNVVKTARVISSPPEALIVLDYSGLLIVTKDGTANVHLGFSTLEDTENKFGGTHSSIGSSAKAFILDSPDSIAADFLREGIERSDILIFEDRGFEIQKVANSIELTSMQNLYHSYSPSNPKYGNWEIASYIRSGVTNFSNGLVQNGDIVFIEVREKKSSEWEIIPCKVLGAQQFEVGFNPRPILEHIGSNPLSNYEFALIKVQRTKEIPVSTIVDSIPRLQEIILDPPTFLSENRDYRIYEEDGINRIHMSINHYGFDSRPPEILWAEVTYLNNNQMIEDNFGKAVKLTQESLEVESDDLDYLSAVRGLWYAYFNGPSLWRVRVGCQILLGLPFAEVDGIIAEINETYNASQIRVLIQDKSNKSVTRSYFIPRSANLEEDGISMVEVNPNTGVEYVVGDEVEQFSPLSKGVAVVDWLDNSDWWKRYAGQGVFAELDKFFKFMVEADVDVFNISNLIFALDFVKNIKPNYTFPLWVVYKRFQPDAISVTDDVQMHGTKYLFDNPACAKRISDSHRGGAFRFDDVDGTGNINWAFDGDPLGGSTRPEFLYDKKRLCPEQEVQAIISANFAGGYFPFDWVWAFDDSGGNDSIPLSGPVLTQPPPYGDPVGVIKFDTTYDSGWYTRGKKL